MLSSPDALYLIVLGLALAGFGLCFIQCRLYAALSILPNSAEERSSHSGVVSRAGGVAILTSFAAASIAALWLGGAPLSGPLGILVILTGAIGMIGLVDDAFSMPPMVKLFGQLIAATVLVSMAGQIETLPLPVLGETRLGATGFFLSVLWVVAFVNIFNFMDGLNGMAAGAALVGLIVMCVLTAMSGQFGLFSVCLIMASCLLAFFLMNYPAGAIFMGDAGSLGLGLLLSGVAILGSRPTAGQGVYLVPFITLPVAFLPFILDTMITLVRRILRRERIYEAHKTHFYQHLQQAGWSHADVTRLYMLAVTACAVAGWLIPWLPGLVQWMGILMVVVLLLVGARLIGRRWIDAAAAKRCQEPALADEEEASLAARHEQAAE